MKKLLFTLFSISILFAFSACGGDDDDKVEKFFNGDIRQTITLKSAEAGSIVTTKPVSTKLEDLLKGSTGYDGITSISTGKFVIAGSNTSVNIVGLPEGTALQGFVLDINGEKLEFGEISNEKKNLNLFKDNYLDSFKKAFNKVISSKKMETKVTFTPTVETTADVKIEIVFSGEFSYWAKQ